MARALSNEAWAQIRADYEHSERTVADICAEHGISSTTLRDRMHRWGWTRRRPLVPLQGPPPLPAPPIAPSTLRLAAACPAPVRALDTAAPAGVPVPAAKAPGVAAMLPNAAGEAAPHASGDDSAIAPRLQSAVARLLPAIETTVARLAAEPLHPREMERSARVLAALTRTLRELNGLLGQHRPMAADAVDDDPVPEDIDEFRLERARRIHAFVDSRTGDADGGTTGDDRAP